MYSDPIVDEIHRIREEIAARFNYDIHAIGEYMRKLDAAGDRKVISLPPRRPIPIPIPPCEPTLEVLNHDLARPSE